MLFAWIMVASGRWFEAWALISKACLDTMEATFSEHEIYRCALRAPLKHRFVAVQEDATPSTLLNIHVADNSSVTSQTLIQKEA